MRAGMRGRDIRAPIAMTQIDEYQMAAKSPACPPSPSGLQAEPGYFKSIMPILTPARSLLKMAADSDRRAHRIDDPVHLQSCRRRGVDVSMT